MQKSKIFLIIGLALVFAAVFYFDLTRYLDFQYLKSQKEAFQSLYDQHPIIVASVYFVIYILVTALSLPGAAVMTLAGGMLLGLFVGTVIVSFASTIGATLAFLAARFLFQDTVQKKFGERLKKLNEGVRKEGSFYLFTMRLIPAFPFFVINLAMGLTPIRTWQFFWVSQVGMLPGTLAYVNAGTQLGQVDSPGEILSLELILSFAVLGILPLARV